MRASKNTLKTFNSRAASEEQFVDNDDEAVSRHEWPTYESTNVFVKAYERWTYAYMNRVLNVGAAQNKKNESESSSTRLSPDDLYRVPSRMASLHLQNEFENYYNDNTTEKDDDEGKAEKTPAVNENRRRLLWTLWKLAAPTMLPAGICQFILVVAQVSNPLIVQQMIELLEDREGESIWRAGLPYVVLTLCAAAINAFANHRQRHLSTQSGVVIRAAVIDMVYKHALALTPQGKVGLSTGQVTNLVAIDGQKLFEVTQEVHLLWSCPLQMVVVAALLLRVMGPATLVGMFILCAFFPIAQRLGATLLAIRKRRIAVSDQRVGIINAMLQGIKVTKLNNYEERYRQRVFEVRRREIAFLHRELFVWACSLMTTMMTPVLASGATFATYVLISEDNRLYASTTFPVLLLFNALRFPISFTGRLVGKAAQALQATQRVAAFLSRETRTMSPTEGARTGKDVSSYENHETPMLTVRNGTFTVEGKSPTADSDDSKKKDEKKRRQSKKRTSDNHSQHTDHEGSIMAATTHSFTLSGVTFSLQRGKILAVVGPVGAGKSTLMNGIVGDVERTDETVVEFGPGVNQQEPRLAFASQIPFVLNATLRDNILFGLPFDEARYEQVLDACCLRQDIEQLGGAGDMTEIGERGVTLSGGQKQRVSLARVAYSNPDIALFDDPLSALDAGTGRKVFDRLFKSQGNNLLSNSAVVLVTHASHLLQRVDDILVLVEGGVTFHGHWNELLTFSAADDSKQHVIDNLRSAHQEEAEEDAADALPDKDDSEQNDANTTDKKKLSASTKSEGGLMTVEKREQGLTHFKTWMRWFYHAGGVTFVLLQVVLLAFERFGYVGTDLWLTRWTEGAEEPVEVFGKTFPAQTDGRKAQFDYLRVYAIIVVIATVSIFLRTQWIVWGGVRSARNLFRLMTTRVLLAPVSYFETTPLGRTLNRFTYDVEVLDFALMDKMSTVFTAGSWFLAALTIVVAIMPWIIIWLVPVGIIYWFLQLYYRQSGADLQRLDAVSRSPLQAMLAEGLDGAATIRIFDKGALFLRKFQAAVDGNSSALLNLVSAQRWLSIRIELLGASVVFVSSLLIIVLNDVIGLQPGLAAVLIMWSSSLTLILGFLVDSITQAENTITSMERVYSLMQLPQEKAMITSEEHCVAKHWPSRGMVEFENVRLRYREGLPLALDDLSFKVEHGMRCGVVGRTGAGKSSLTVALFRLVEIESGRILLDGVDLAPLGLSDVRGRPNGMAIIPQDPVLFAGTVRECIDPFGGSTDEQVLDALQAVRLSGVTFDQSDHSETPGLALERRVEEGGSNFSVGERQLLCLARAVLAKPKVLVLDEATASVDGETDAFIQSMLRSRFQDTTLITVAHRLDTIMDYDTVLVMSEGRAVQFGPPKELLEDSSGVFAELVNATGEESAKALRLMAGVEE